MGLRVTTRDDPRLEVIAMAHSQNDQTTLRWRPQLDLEEQLAPACEDRRRALSYFASASSNRDGVEIRARCLSLPCHLWLGLLDRANFDRRKHILPRVEGETRAMNRDSRGLENVAASCKTNIPSIGHVPSNCRLS